MMMGNCKNCGVQLPGLAKYCPDCGTAVDSPITYQYVEEDEKDFAFHSEYYGAIGGCYPGHVWEHSCGCTWYDGVLYDLHKENDQYYILKITEDGSVLDIFDLGKSEIYFCKLCSNRHGIFLVDDQCVFVYDFQGKKKREIVFKETFGEQYQVSDYYIFGSMLYVALYKKVRNVTIPEFGMCVKVYDFLTDRMEMVWSLDQETEELEVFAKSQLMGQMEEYGGGKNLQRAEKPGWEIITEPTVCANSQYAVISYELSAAPTDGNDYQVLVYPFLLLDFKTGCCEDIKGVYKGKQGVDRMRLDLRRNRMWLPGKGNASIGVDQLLGFPIQNWSEIDLERYEDIWRFDTKTDHSFDWEKCYFDGEHAYRADGLYFFYAFQKDGSRAVEWNRSGHGQTHCTVLGPFVYASLDLQGGFFRHSIELPEEKYFDWDRDVVEEMIRERQTKQIHVAVEEAPGEPEKPDVVEIPEELRETEESEIPEEPETLEKPDVPETLEESQEAEVPETSENPERAFDSMSILRLRELFQNSSEYSEQLKTFRKDLKDDKWDFNVVMGILLGSRKRHATGPRHIQEQNAGIGQGDNKDMVVVTLDQYGMMDIYENYEKISDPDIMVAQAIRDICERTPKLTYICDAIRTILR